MKRSPRSFRGVRDRGRFRLTAAIAALVLAPLAVESQSPVFAPAYRHGLVTSESAIASRVGENVLRRGGNAVDAAVATAFALAVTHPTAGNIGGGGFLVVANPDGSATTFDFRERAPSGATETMFAPDGKYDARRHHGSAFSVGVPGSVAGLFLAHQRLGRLDWAELVEPAVNLARDGFEISAALAASLEAALPRLRPYAASLRQFSRDGAPYAAGDRLRQPDLAATLTRIRDQGPGGFYRGETARLIAREMERRGGLISLADLESYRALERKPVEGRYRGHRVIGMGPPSSGGIAVIQMLQILEGYPLGEIGIRGSDGVHRIAEAMRRAFAERARHIGDPDFVDVDIARLTSAEHAARLRGSISPSRASVSSPDSFEWPRESDETTHLSVVDRHGMAASLTTTLEYSYGSGIVVEGAGFLLNNEMGDFNPVRGDTNSAGRIGTDANLVAPGKRMLSSMSPTIVLRDGRVRLVVGSPGGRTIINTVLLIILGVIDGELGIQEAVDAARFHHQWLPDRILAERGAFSPDTLRALRALDHRVDVRPTGSPQGSAMAILVDVTPDGRRELTAGVDRRRGGGGAAGW